VLGCVEVLLCGAERRNEREFEDGYEVFGGGTMAPERVALIRTRECSCWQCWM
jgi:hypothetical protein